MIISCILLLVVLFIGFAVWMVGWCIHISMNKDERKPYDWCTFKTFKREFDKYKDNPNLHKGGLFPDSIFLDGTNSVYLHASIIKFNEKCMILYPYSWLRYCIWKRRYIKSCNRQRGLWKQENIE